MEIKEILVNLRISKRLRRCSSGMKSCYTLRGKVFQWRQENQFSITVRGKFICIVLFLKVRQIY